MDVAMSMGIYGDGAWAGGDKGWLMENADEPDGRDSKSKDRHEAAGRCIAWIHGLTSHLVPSSVPVWCNKMRDWSGTV